MVGGHHIKRNEYSKVTAEINTYNKIMMKILERYYVKLRTIKNMINVVFCNKICVFYQSSKAVK